jgi:hypothetical protein
LIQEAHPEMTNYTELEAAAKEAFNIGAKAFFLATLRIAAKLRPKGKFG